MALGVSRSSRIFPWIWFPISAIKRPAVCPCGIPTGDDMAPRSEPANTVWPFPFTPQDWAQTPPAVQAYLRTVRDELRQLQEHVARLEARLHQDSTTSHRPPSSDNPYKKPRQRTSATTPRKAGGKPGHPGHRQVLLAPTRIVEVQPEPCVCGSTAFAGTRPYYTHQVIELPRITMEVTHWVLHQGWCQVCGRWNQAHIPAEQSTGMGHGSVPSSANWPGPMV